MTPVQSEMCLVIQKAVVDFYGVPVGELITDSRKTGAVERRYMLFYLLKYTGLTQKDLEQALKIPHNTISTGQQYISDKLPIYPHISATLAAIIEKTDSFEKNYQWQIVPPFKQESTN